MDIGERLMELHSRTPFVPFRIRLKDGRTIVLSGARKFAMNRFLMIIGQERGPALRVRVDQVASIEVLERIS